MGPPRKKGKAHSSHRLAFRFHSPNEPKQSSNKRRYQQSGNHSFTVCHTIRTSQPFAPILPSADWISSLVVGGLGPSSCLSFVLIYDSGKTFQFSFCKKSMTQFLTIRVFFWQTTSGASLSPLAVTSLPRKAPRFLSERKKNEKVFALTKFKFRNCPRTRALAPRGHRFPGGESDWSRQVGEQNLAGIGTKHYGSGRFNGHK